MAPGKEHEGGFLVPCVLLMVRSGRRGPDELRELVEAFGLRRQAGSLQKMLDRLEKEALIQRVRPRTRNDGRDDGYALTTRGQRWLDARAQELAAPTRLVERFLDRYAVSIGIILNNEPDEPADQLPGASRIPGRE